MLFSFYFCDPEANFYLGFNMLFPLHGSVRWKKERVIQSAPHLPLEISSLSIFIERVLGWWKWGLSVAASSISIYTLAPTAQVTHTIHRHGNRDGITPNHKTGTAERQHGGDNSDHKDVSITKRPQRGEQEVPRNALSLNLSHWRRQARCTTHSLINSSSQLCI